MNRSSTNSNVSNTLFKSNKVNTKVNNSSHKLNNRNKQNKNNKNKNNKKNNKKNNISEEHSDEINNILGNKSPQEQSAKIEELSNKKSPFKMFSFSSKKKDGKDGFFDNLYKKSKKISKPLNKISLKDGKMDVKQTIYNYFILLLVGVVVAVLLYIVIFAVYYHKEKCHEKKIFGDYLKGFSVDNPCKTKDKPNTDLQEYKERKKLKENEVFHISNQNLTYDDAKCKCEAYGGRLATKNEIIEVYNKGAEWCTYGWSEGQNAYYPTQKCTWDKLQEGPKKDRNKCGKPGINGGYFASTNIKFGANCYGIKPEGNVAIPKKPFCKKKAFCKRADNKDASSKLVSDDISGFNSDKWSEYD